MYVLYVYLSNDEKIFRKLKLRTRSILLLGVLHYKFIYYIPTLHRTQRLTIRFSAVGFILYYFTRRLI